MPQTPQNLPAITPGKTSAPLQLDLTGNLLTGSASVTKLNVTAATVIKAGPGRICKVINNAGVAGFTINDCLTTGAASAANTVMVISTTTVGQVISLDIPCAVGIVISAVGASGVLAVSYD